MTCKGICVGRYASGQRRCQICEIFIKWEGLWCPCCGYRLRTKPRNLKYKAKLRARVEADSIEAKAIAQEKQEEIVEEVVAVKVKAKAAKTTVKAKAAKTTVKAKAAKTTVKAKAAKTRKTKAKVLPKTESIAIKA